MEHWENLSLENLTENIDGVLYTEEWRPIKGYERKYHVSSFGRIKSLKYAKSDKPGILKPSLIQAGYLRVDLVKKSNHQFVHILVAKNFIPNPENKPEVNHKWGDTKDNRVIMLEWATKSEQQIHAQKVLGFKPAIEHLAQYVKKTKVKRIDPLTNSVLQIYNSQKEAYASLGLHKDAIYRVLKGKQELAGGYKWEYA